MDDREKRNSTEGKITDNEMNGVTGGAVTVAYGYCTACGTRVVYNGSRLYCPKCRDYVDRYLRRI